MNENRNSLVALFLSALVVLAWYLYNRPQFEQRAAQTQAQTQSGQQPAGAPAPQPSALPQPNAAPPNGGAAAPVMPAEAPRPILSREAAIAASPRVRIDTPRLTGSISLKGARIDDLALVSYRETADPKSPAIVLYSPENSSEAYYAQFSWLPPAGSNLRVPVEDSEWQQEGAGALTPSSPVLLKYDNGEGLTFRRRISVDEHYLFTIRDEVTNSGAAPVTLYPYGKIERHGTPHVSGYYILHEGLIGYLGDHGLQEYAYKKMDDPKTNGEVKFADVVNGWMGITDKYWASALLPDTTAQLVDARFTSKLSGNGQRIYATAYALGSRTAAAGETISADARLFAGAKEAGVVGINFPMGSYGGYNKELGLNHFDLLIDWGWFYFITKPMFLGLDFFFRWLGNFGVAILIVTVIVKLLFFPLANKSYASMAKMKLVAPQLQALRERYPDDKMKQQQEMMEIYRREKINPVSGCLPTLIQIPVFFSLYKVLFVTIEMRHAPFIGWIHDLSAADPTNLFNLFGLLPFDPTHIVGIGPWLALGAWPVLMGFTMWFQMKLNPAPPDPTQKMMFDWMPLIFTFMLAAFPAGLVIYWAWNNLLSVAQQAFIMRRNNVPIELFDNIRATFGRKTPT